ncbi:FAD-dependent monooxygenase [Streptomyces himalayensis]|uniref:FAD-dependent monooxygenase n=1 Tax=Streptomyces himalayensis subsp. himalayensis TaxID=2756131 RepID=A0A7W0DV06_9ACTN|nr:FAD-dependent monooxygenase [Streptomyces himalayensis]MBA2951390.1 FAD-dependent monooxygenase [Streptomyces himalayensis subsp. himalayensis]
MMSTETGPKIAILGGGIGGLAAAAFLRDKGFDSDVYEQAAALTDVGAGLVIAPNAARLLRRLGVLDRFVKRAVRMEIGWEFRRWENGAVLSAENLQEGCRRLYGEHTYAAHRADLLDALRSAVPEHSVHLGKRCVSVEFEGDQAVLRFEDGETVRPDILIGADGVHSRVRGAVGGSTQARESGICAFRALVPAEKAPDFARRRAQTLWIGPDHHLVHYPVSGEEYVNLVAFAPAGVSSVESWTATATLGELLDEFAGWDPRLVELIRAADTPGRWALLDREPLDHWNRGNATLLGDAAHPMFPFFAQGAAQAIEDGAVLALCLAEDPDNPIAALGRYEELRRRRTARLQEVSHGRSHINHLPDGPEQQARDLAYSQADPLRANGWIYEYDPEVAVSDLV